MEPLHRAVFVVEPNFNLAGALHDVLLSWGFRVATFATHGAAAVSAILVDRVDLLVACVPASDGDRNGAYLESIARRQAGGLPIVLMVTDREIVERSAPDRSVRLLKPFTCDELRGAMYEAGISFV
jgi:DNA-binding response OmpR family regulator